MAVISDVAVISDPSYNIDFPLDYFKIITSLPFQMSNQLALYQTVVGGIKGQLNDQLNDQLLTHQNHLMHQSEPFHQELNHQELK